MDKYRKFETTTAVQYSGEPIPDVTCEGTREQRDVNGCDNTRGHLPHVHTRSIGGLTVLQKGDWIQPVVGGPFQVWSDANFRAYHEVPGSESVDLASAGPVLVLVPATEPATSSPGPVLVTSPEPVGAAPAPGATGAATDPSVAGS